MTAFLSRMARDPSGATAVEYGLIVALIGVAVVASATLVGVAISAKFDLLSTTITAAGS
jgi:pilus assembly protein Flp/PilA